MSDLGKGIDVRRIFDLLPHRYPFLLVDRVLDYEIDTRIEALKNVTFNEPFFQGHFPGLPVMPGVLILEAMAQCGGILVSLSAKESLAESLFMFSGMDKVRFRRPVYPGDQLILRCSDLRRKFKLVKMVSQALVNGDVVAEAELSASMVSRRDV